MNPEFPRGCIIIFAKRPLPGRVKTRLSPRLTSVAAAELAQAGLQDTHRLAARMAPVVLAWDGDLRAVPPLTPRPSLREQSPGDLGRRMGDAFATSLSGGAPWVIALGTDSPGLPVDALRGACAWLDQASEARAVLGPSADGGYYLLGLSAWQHGLLENLPWSQPSTLAATELRLRARGYSCHTVRPYFDVDDAEDLELMLSRWRRGELDAPATSAWIERWFSDARA